LPEYFALRINVVTERQESQFNGKRNLKHIMLNRRLGRYRYRPPTQNQRSSRRAIAIDSSRASRPIAGSGVRKARIKLVDGRLRQREAGGRLPSLATEVKVEALLAAARDVYGSQAIAAISTGAR